MGGCFSVSISCDQMVNQFSRWLCLKGSYIHNLAENLVSLEKAMGVLKAKRDDVQGRVHREEFTGHRQRLAQVQSRPAAPKRRNQRIKVRLRNPNAVIRLKFTLPPRSETPRTFSNSRRRNRRPSRRETVKRTAIPYNRTSDIELRSTHRPLTGSWHLHRRTTRATALTWGSTAPEIQPKHNERERYHLDDDGRLLLRLDDQVQGGGDKTSSDEAAGRRSASTHGEHEA
ncbi:hypothetical protein F2Q68_00013297 [Brassica cretica]|uniref:Uncharacterized protein n=1 Tax=Brassica cretica TaxID=69181 RepID=A0A8S9HT93_BRACR|nr:hypothetical protein F2Q68_00013297 [Brassica cretica]